MKFKILLLSIALACQTAYACSCAEAPPVSKALAAADFVVYGRCQSFSLISESYRIAKIQVKAVFKGENKESETIEIETAADGASCGFGFIAGDYYLIYGYKDGTKLRTNICTRTKLLPQGIYLKTDQEYMALELMKNSAPEKWHTYDPLETGDPFKNK